MIQQSIHGGIDLEESAQYATDYTKDILKIDRKADPVGPIVAIVAIPILGAIIVTALKRTFDRRRKS